MKNNYFDKLKSCPLFGGISEAEMGTLLSCLSATEKHYEKNSFVFMSGDNVRSIGIVLEGGVHITQEDFWGNKTILAEIGSGGLFAEAFSCAETEELPVNVLAVRESDILLIDYRRIIKTCSSACGFHTSLIRNMLVTLARKNIMLTQKMEILSRRTTREKLLAYLSGQALKAGSNSFEIPFNRQELSEYLSVDRSAMSNELSKMRNDGILEFHRNSFILITH